MQLKLRGIRKQFGENEVLKGIESLPKAQNLLAQAQKVLAMRQ